MDLRPIMKHLLLFVIIAWLFNNTKRNVGSYFILSILLRLIQVMFNISSSPYELLYRVEQIL